MKLVEDEDGEVENTTKVKYYYMKAPEENKGNSDTQQGVTNIYGNPNGMLNGGNQNGEKTPGTGDIIPVVTIIAIAEVLVSNMILYIIRKRTKNKKDFIK